MVFGWRPILYVFSKTLHIDLPAPPLSPRPTKEDQQRRAADAAAASNSARGMIREQVARFDTRQLQHSEEEEEEEFT